MSLTAQASDVVAATPQEILEFVLDLEEYSKIDKKFVRVSSVEGPDADGKGSVKLWGRMRGMPPAPDRQDFVLDRWSGITFTGAPRQPGRMVFDFVGTFVCEPADNGHTNVTHAYEFRFKGPFKLLEKPLTNWLQTQVEDEVEQLKNRFIKT